MEEESKTNNHGMIPGSNQDSGPAHIMTETASNHQMDHEMTVAQSEQQQPQQRDEEQVGSKPNPNGFFADTGDANACSVRVAVRIRPLIGKELRSGDKICVDSNEETDQIIMGKDRAFTFDRAFGIDSQQEVVFDTCVKNLVLGCFVGFNATILAYGQTGSGKTFTMGSGYTIGVKEEDLGIIPRVIRMIFDEKEARKNKAEIIIKCSFLEIYNEELHDLLERNMSSSTMINQIMPAKKEISVREEKNGTISVYGLKEMTVNSAEEMAGCLDMGSSQRVTACTLMNSSSSRSHGIFTISIEQHLIEDLIGSGAPGAPVQGSKEEKPDEYMMAKFHFVDLAGSERAKSTGATGDQFREGVNINKGLLALGNVIASLTEASKNGHIPYRDSKLTRILQDSLGGNSRTVMIAACSPAECNFGETLNTLKYASRARNIKNKPIVNRDPASQQIAQLRQMVYELQKELLGTRKVLLTNDIAFESNVELPEAEALEKMGAQIQNANKAMGIVPLQGGGGGGGANPAEVKRLESQVQELKAQLSSKDKELKSQKSAHETLQDQHSQSQIEKFELQKDRDYQKYSLEELVKVLKQRNIFEDVVKQINGGVLPQQSEDGVNIFDVVFGNAGPTILEEYQRKVEESQKEVQETQVQLSQLQNDNQQLIEQAALDTKSLEGREIELEKQRRMIDNLNKEISSLHDDIRSAKTSTPGGTGQPKANSFSNRRSAHNPGMLRRNTVAAPRIDTSKWLNDDFAGVKLKNFDEMRENFIEDLTNQFSDLLVPNSGRSRYNSVKMPQNQSLNEQDEGQEGNADQQMNEDGDKKSDNGSEEDDDQLDDDSDEESSMIPDEKPDEAMAAAGGTTMDLDLLNQINNLENEEQNLTEQVTQKEALLETIKGQQKMMQDTLLKEMREEYHKKISSMVDEITRLETEKNLTLQSSAGNAQRSRVEDQFKKKEAELKIKLKELEQKQREQMQLTKSLNQQKLKTNSMEQEIGKMKTQKVTMMKRIKEETENRAKMQKVQAKQNADLKRKIAKQQREIDTIKREKTKVDIQAKRKHEEVVAMQKRQKMDQQKKNNATKMRQQAKKVDTTKIREWIIENTEKMVDYQFMQIEKVKEQNQCAEIEQRIEEEQVQYGRLSVECDKLLQRQGRLQLLPEGSNDDDIYQTERDIQDTQNQITQIRETIKSYEDEQKFIHSKITERSKQLISVKPNSVDSMVFAEMQTLEGARACIGTFFQLLLDSNLQLREQWDEIEQFKKHIEALVSEITEVNNLRKQDERQKELELEKLHSEYVEKERMLVQLILQKISLNIDFDMNNPTEEQWDQINLLDLIDLFIKQVKASNDSQYDEHMTVHEKEMLQNSKNEGLKKAVNAKVENREAKKENYNANKAALAKRNAELEKKQVENEIALKRTKSQLDNAVQEKARFKRMYDEEKRKKGSLDEATLLQSVNSAALSVGHSLKDQRALRKIARQQNSITGLPATNKPNGNVLPAIQVPDDLMLNKIGNSDDPLAFDAAAEQDDQNNMAAAQESQDVFRRLNEPRGRRRNAASPRPESAAQQMQRAASRDLGPSWMMVHDKHDAHKSQVYAMTSVGNQLYSAAARSLRIWDISQMRLLSDLTDKIGVIKAIAFWKDRNLLMTAAEKNIMMWDVVSLTNVGVLKGFKEEIRALHFVPEKQLLFAASKGSNQSAGLLVYDLRKSYNNPLYEREKNQDVFSLQSTGGHIFYGCRNHNVYPFCLQTFNTLQNLQPPHFDVVTSLALLNNGSTLVSGSRDKNLRLYDLTRPNFPEMASCLTAHNDHINVLETDESSQFLYSGSRDGMVKVWQSQQQDLQLVANLEGNAQHGSINTICNLNTGDGTQAFACGSNDKSIRVYRVSDQASLQQPVHPSADQQHNSMAAATSNMMGNVEMADETAQGAQGVNFTASQLGQLQELEMGLQSMNYNGQQPDQQLLQSQSNAAHAAQLQNQQQQQMSEESGALSQLRRRKQQKQIQQQQQNQ